MAVMRMRGESPTTQARFGIPKCNLRDWEHGRSLTFREKIGGTDIYSQTEIIERHNDRNIIDEPKFIFSYKRSKI